MLSLTTMRLFPVPPIVSRRAWECAFDLGQEHSSFINNDRLWNLLQQIVTQRDPEGLNWVECQSLFIIHRHYRPARAA